MLRQFLLHCYFHFFYINCWLILTSCCKTRRKMLVFDRPSIFPLTLVFLSCSPLYSLPLSFRYMHKILVAGRKTRGCIRYSLFFSFTVFTDRPLQSTLEPRSRRSPVSSTTLSSPLTRSSLEVPRQEASPFRSCCVCASLLKATLFSCVCTHIRLLPLTLCSRAILFEPSRPLACNI